MNSKTFAFHCMIALYFYLFKLFNFLSSVGNTISYGLSETLIFISPSSNATNITADDVNNIATQFQAKTNDITAFVPSGYHASINASSINFNSKHLRFLFFGLPHFVSLFHLEILN